jgi:thiosulfate/3-mercaptopyruvate sulfurtransferase
MSEYAHPEYLVSTQWAADHLHDYSVNLVDVRSPDEFTGKIIAPFGLPETAQRPGHIPGARNIPWSKTAREDGSWTEWGNLIGSPIEIGEAVKAA